MNIYQYKNCENVGMKMFYKIKIYQEEKTLEPIDLHYNRIYLLEIPYITVLEKKE